MRVDCEITAEEIEHGERCKCWTCPGALAMTRALQAAGFAVEVGATTEFVLIMPLDTGSNACMRATTPSILRLFIRRYDLGAGDSPELPVRFSLTFDSDAWARLEKMRHAS